MYYVKLGSLSSGTTVPNEIASNLAFELKRLAKADPEPARAAQVLAALDAYEVANAAGDDEALARFNEETAPDLLGSYCAPYTYFCVRDQESEFGIAPDILALNEALYDKDGVVRGEAGVELPKQAEDVHYIVEVNDHGNMTLFDAHTREEIWACV